MNEVRLSIITATYNAEKYIKKVIENVLAQEYDNYEYIIVDGGSKDCTIQIIEQHITDKIRYISEKDRGIYDAFNKGVKLARGDFILFLGADDLLYDNKVLKTFNSLIQSKNKDITYYGDVIKTSNMRRYCGSFDKLKLSKINICHQAIFYSKKVFYNNEYDLSYKLLADYVFNIKNFSSMQHLDFVVSIYNDETGQSAKHKDRKFVVMQYFLNAKYLGIRYFFSCLFFKINLHIFKKEIDFI